MKTSTPRPGRHIPLLPVVMPTGLLAWHLAPVLAWPLAVGSTAAVVQTLATDAGGIVYLAESFQDSLRQGHACPISAGGLGAFVAEWRLAVVGCGPVRWAAAPAAEAPAAASLASQVARVDKPLKIKSLFARKVADVYLGLAF